jgi:hypothetical protein
MTEENKLNWLKTAALWIGAGLLGKFLGFLGLGAAVLGYFVYKKMLETKDKTIAVMIGLGVGVGAYVLVAFLIIGSK